VRLGRFGTAPVAGTGVIACVVLAVASAVVQVPKAVGYLGARARYSASLSPSDREFAAGNSVVPDQMLLYEARNRIPRDASYRVLTGPLPIEGATSLTRSRAKTFATYFLLPRRPAPASHWIICLGCDRRQLTRAKVVWDDNAGSSLLQVGR
jgi:hypothetical protein